MNLRVMSLFRKGGKYDKKRVREKRILLWRKGFDCLKVGVFLINNLDYWMCQREFTTLNLSKDTGIPKQTLDAYRAGRRSISLENGLKIATALCISPFLLLGDKEKDNEI